MVKCKGGDEGTGEQLFLEDNYSMSSIALGSPSSKMSRDARCEALEKTHVHDVYGRTAHHFSGVRYKAWPRVKKFIMELEPGSLVADVGCGNGRYMNINKNVYKLGSDRCGELVELAAQVGHEVMTCDNLHLPYRDSCFDAVISIGVIHHLTTPKRRAAAVSELARILRPGGKLMIYVWAMEQKHRKFDGQDVLVPWHLQHKQPKHRKERNVVQRRETTLSSVSSFSEDEGVSEPCQAATEFSLQEYPGYHFYHCPHNNQHIASCMLEADIDPKCLQRNFSLPSPIRRTSFTTAERSHSWDQSCHTAHLHMHNTMHTDIPHQCPHSAVQTPQHAKFSILSHQQGAHAFTEGPTFLRKEGVEPALSPAKAQPEFAGSSSLLNQSSQLASQCSYCKDYTAKKDEISAVPEPKSISAAIKSKVVGFFQRQFSSSPETSAKQTNSNLCRRSKIKDEEYKKLVEYIMREEAELLHCERPALEHTVSAPESTELFAVREFPQSSQILTRRKSRSLDEPAVIPPPRVRRQSKSLDETPCIEESFDSNEDDDNACITKSSHKTDDDHSVPHSSEKGFEAEQSCDSGNQSDSGAQDGILTEEQYNTDYSTYVRNDSGTVVEEKENTIDTSSDTSSEIIGEEPDVEEFSTEQLEDDVQDEDVAAAEDAEAGATVKALSPKLVGRSNLWMRHKKVSPVTSNGSCSDRSSVETDCDEWARTTEAVIRSMQNQMLQRQSAVEDFSVDFDRFTTSSSGDSRLCQLTYEELANGSSPQSPPYRRGSEASTISSDGVSVTESPSDIDESDIWKTKANSSSENCSPVKEFQLPQASIRSDDSSSSNSSNNSTQSSPGEQPTYHRFYHVFREGELVDLIERHVENLHVLSCFYDHANWCVIAERVRVWRI